MDFWKMNLGAILQKKLSGSADFELDLHNIEYRNKLGISYYFCEEDGTVILFRTVKDEYGKRTSKHDIKEDTDLAQFATNKELHAVYIKAQIKDIIEKIVNELIPVYEQRNYVVRH
jgi:hypothetical protein